MEHKTPPHPSIIKKMRTFLELEGKLSLKPQSLSNQYRPSQPDTNTNARKDSKVTEKRKRIAPTKRFKVKIAAKPDPDKVTEQPSNTKAPMNTESQKTLTPENKPPPLEDTPIHRGIPWPKAGKMLGNLFETRKDWLIPPNYNNDNNINTAIATSLTPPIEIEPKPKEQPTTSPIEEKCGWGPNCPICKNIEEDWDGDRQKQLQWHPQPQVQIPQYSTLRPWITRPPMSNSKTFDVSK